MTFFRRRLCNSLIRRLRNSLNRRLRASFTIEAAVILPIIFLVTVWVINMAFKIHGSVISYNSAISSIIESAPESADVPPEYSGIIRPESLEGRKMLLKYKLLKDGIHMISDLLEDN